MPAAQDSTTALFQAFCESYPTPTFFLGFKFKFKMHSRRDFKLKKLIGCKTGDVNCISHIVVPRGSLLFLIVAITYVYGLYGRWGDYYEERS